VTFHEILNTVLFHRVKILAVTGLSMIFLFVILLFAYPITYNSMVTVLPPDNSSQNGLGSLLAGGADLSSMFTGKTGSATSQLFLEILKSRTAGEYVVKKLNLASYYGSRSLEDAVDKVLKSMDAEVTKEGIIKLSVDVSTPMFSRFNAKSDSARVLSARISNTFVEALDYLNREKMMSKAKRSRIYLEEQIKVTKNELDSSEIRLMQFQKENKAISLPEQVKASIDNAAKLKSEIVANEIQLGLLSTNLREDNEIYIALKTKINELKSQYDKLENGNQDYLLSFKDVPSFGLKLAALMRDQKINNEVYLLLQQQYYKEKIQENRDLPTIEVLDKAIEPEKPKGPRLLFATATGGVFVFLVMCMAFVISDKRELKVK